MRAETAPGGTNTNTNGGSSLEGANVSHYFRGRSLLRFRQQNILAKKPHSVPLCSNFLVQHVMCCTPQDKSIGQPRQATEHKTLFHEQVPRRSICLGQVGMRWRVVRGVRGDLALLSQYAKQAPRGVLCEHKIDLGINVSQLHIVTRLAPHFTGKLH